MSRSCCQPVGRQHQVVPAAAASIRSARSSSRRRRLRARRRPTAGRRALAGRRRARRPDRPPPRDAGCVERELLGEPVEALPEALRPARRAPAARARGARRRRGGMSSAQPAAALERQRVAARDDRRAREQVDEGRDAARRPPRRLALDQQHAVRQRHLAVAAAGPAPAARRPRAGCRRAAKPEQPLPALAHSAAATARLASGPGPQICSTGQPASAALQVGASWSASSASPADSSRGPGARRDQPVEPRRRDSRRRADDGACARRA